MKKTALTTMALGAFFAAPALAVPGVALQGVFDGITQGGPSSVDVSTDFISDALDSKWQIGGSGGSVSTIVIELAGFADNTTFGIYDVANPLNSVEIFDGAATNNLPIGSQATISILGDGSVILNTVNDTGIDLADNLFGYYIDTQVDQPGVGRWHSDTSLNSDGFDHMFAYQGVGDTVEIPPFAAGPWGQNEYILAFEDIDGGGDQDFTDFVVLVESVSPVPDGGTTVMLLGLSLLGMRGVRKMIGR